MKREQKAQECDLPAGRQAQETMIRIAKAE
jgi:hypothetical protein